LPASLAAKLLYSQEQPISSDDKQEECAPKPTKEDLDKDFEVFYQEDLEDLPAPSYYCLAIALVSTSQEVTNIPEAMVLEEKTPNLLALLTAHAGGNALTIPIVP